MLHERDNNINTNVLQSCATFTNVKTIAERLKFAREELGLSQPELAKKAGVSQGTIGNIETGTRKQPRNLLQLADALGVTPVWLSTGHGPMHAHPYSSNVEPGPNTRGSVPLISWVQAGQWCEACEPLPANFDSDTYLPCPVAHSPHTFALRVKGDSMTAPHGRSYPEGCIIYVDPERRSPINGDRIIACLDGGSKVTFKVYKNEDGRQWLLPLNPQHLPLHERFTVLGTVLGKWEDG